MSNTTTFDSLPNELIICIFRYLQPAENFQSFFDCNNRFRKLVKRYVPCNRRALDDDIKRFSTLHSWYKHLSFNDGGVTFYIVPLKGEQERYSFDPCVSDPHGIHWHFSRQQPMPLLDERIEQISQKYPIKLNPLFHLVGVWFERNPESDRDLIRRYYPSQFEGLETILSKGSSAFSDVLNPCIDDERAKMEIIRKNEPKRMRDTIQIAADRIWKEIQALEDVNILEIGY